MTCICICWLLGRDTEERHSSLTSLAHPIPVTVIDHSPDPMDLTLSLSIPDWDPKESPTLSWAPIFCG